MLDIKLIRNNPDIVKDSIKKRNLNIDLDTFLELDKKKLRLIIKVDELRSIKNKVSKEIPNLSSEEKLPKIAEMKKLWSDLDLLENEQRMLDESWKELYYQIPNILDETAAIWNTDEDNTLVSKFLEPTKFDFKVKTHYEIGEKKGWIDIEKGSDISWSRFWYLKWDLVLLQFAIVNYWFSILWAKWYTPMLPPLLTKQNAMFGTGYYPASEDWLYNVNPSTDDLYLIWTSEVPVTSYHSNETLDLEKPIKYVGYSTCFRREAGSAGKDTKWILRGHQFDKVEMVVFSKSEESKKIHDEMVQIEEDIWQGLWIPYQKLNVCSWDLWNPAMKKYDLEAWMPWENKYREVTSCSNVWEYQSRRLWIKYKDEKWASNYAHTLNGTVIALGRCLIAVMENNQNKDWDIIIPEVLVPFMWGKKII